MMKYKEEQTLSGNLMIVRDDGNGVVTYIPSDTANSDYQRYLRWLEKPDAEEGGTL